MSKKVSHLEKARAKAKSMWKAARKLAETQNIGIREAFAMIRDSKSNVVATKAKAKRVPEYEKTPKYIGWLFYDEIVDKFRLRLRWPKIFEETFNTAQDAVDRCDRVIGAETSVVETVFGFRVLNPEHLRRLALEAEREE